VPASAIALARAGRERAAGAGGRRRRGLLIGGLLVAVFALSVILAPWIAAYDPGAVPTALSDTMLRPPQPTHPFGTDALGRDLLSRVLHGSRVSLALGFGVEAVIVTPSATISVR
jgi:peptide/nickel transport system permease protein